jgi:hypothetical protein
MKFGGRLASPSWLGLTRSCPGKARAQAHIPVAGLGPATHAFPALAVALKDVGARIKSGHVVAPTATDVASTLRGHDTGLVSPGGTRGAA